MARSSSATEANATSGVFSEGFHTSALPHASAKAYLNALNKMAHGERMNPQMSG